MKKALKILGIAIVAAAVFAGCEQGPQEVTGDVKVSYKQGYKNYDVEGKKLTYVDTSYLTKTTYVTDTSKPELGTSSTSEKIAYKATTVEIAFNDDNTYTQTETTVYLPGADGNFRTYINTPAGTTVRTTISYTGDADLCGVIVTGLAGLTESVSVTTGTWNSFKKVDSSSDAVTLEFAINTTSSVNTTTGIVYTESDVAADPNYGVTEKDTYKVSGNNAVANSTFDSYWTLRPESTGEKTVGDDEFDIILLEYNGDTCAFVVTDIE